MTTKFSTLSKILSFGWYLIAIPLFTEITELLTASNTLAVGIGAILFLGFIAACCLSGFVLITAIADLIYSDSKTESRTTSEAASSHEDISV